MVLQHMPVMRPLLSYMFEPQPQTPPPPPPSGFAERTGEARPAGAVVGALSVDAAGIGWAGHSLSQALINVHVAVWALIPAPKVIRLTHSWRYGSSTDFPEFYRRHS